MSLLLFLAVGHCYGQTVVTSYGAPFDASLLAGAYAGGAYDPQNKRVYFAPSKQATQENWHYLDARTQQIRSYPHPNAGKLVSGAYSGAVYSPQQQRLYLVPSAQASQLMWHYIDTATQAVVSYAPGLNAAPSSQAYRGGAYSPQANTIVFAPFNQALQPEWHRIDCGSGEVVPYPAPAIAETVAGAYASAVLAGTFVYLVPFAQGPLPQWHRFDTAQLRVESYSHDLPVGKLAVDQAYLGAAFAPEINRVYFAPHAQALALSKVWHYIDIKFKEVGAYTHTLDLAELTNGAYSGAVSSPLSQQLQLVPYNQASADKWHYLDVSGSAPSVVVSFDPAATGFAQAAAYEGGVFVPDLNRTYFVPSGQAPLPQWHFVVVGAQLFPTVQPTASPTTPASGGGGGGGRGEIAAGFVIERLAWAVTFPVMGILFGLMRFWSLKVGKKAVPTIKAKLQLIGFIISMICSIMCVDLWGVFDIYTTTASNYLPIVGGNLNSCLAFHATLKISREVLIASYNTSNRTMPKRAFLGYKVTLYLTYFSISTISILGIAVNKKLLVFNVAKVTMGVVALPALVYFVKSGVAVWKIIHANTKRLSQGSSSDSIVAKSKSNENKVLRLLVLGGTTMMLVAVVVLFEGLSTSPEMTRLTRRKDQFPAIGVAVYVMYFLGLLFLMWFSWVPLCPCCPCSSCKFEEYGSVSGTSKGSRGARARKTFKLAKLQTKSSTVLSNSSAQPNNVSLTSSDGQTRPSHTLGQDQPPAVPDRMGKKQLQVGSYSVTEDWTDHSVQYQSPLPPANTSEQSLWSDDGNVVYQDASSFAPLAVPQHQVSRLAETAGQLSSFEDFVDRQKRQAEAEELKTKAGLNTLSAKLAAARESSVKLQPENGPLAAGVQYNKGAQAGYSKLGEDEDDLDPPSLPDLPPSLG